MYTNSGDPIQNPKVPLDPNIISALLGSFLRSDPEVLPYVMPDFRLLQLCKFVRPKGTQFERNKMFHGLNNVKPHLIESVGALYCLCLYLLVAPNVNSKVAPRVVHIVRICYMYMYMYMYTVCVRACVCVRVTLSASLCVFFTLTNPPPQKKTSRTAGARSYV